jgi:hypothetical protein
MDSMNHHLFSLLGGAQLWRLRRKDVQEELAISDEQRREIDRLWGELQEQRHGFGFRESPGFSEMDQEDRRKKFDDLAQRNEKKVAGLLRPDQAERLKQIALQGRLPYTFRDDENVAEALGLTPEQLRNIQTIVEIYISEVQAVRHDSVTRGLPHEQTRQMTDEVRKTATDNILKLLTDDQNKQWAQLIGKPFKASGRMGPGGWDAHPPKPRYDRPGNNRPPKGGPPLQ